MTHTVAEAGAAHYEEILSTAEGGLSDTHRAIIGWTPPGSRVLELGCATGYIGEILVRDRSCRVDAIEIDPAAAARARQRGLSVRVGSLDDPATFAPIEGPYDLVIAADVIEHLRDPTELVMRLRRWIGEGGAVILAVPNVAVWSMRVRLLRGDFDYEDDGLLDRTHLRFFTWDTLHDLVDRAGLRVRDTFVEGWELPFAETLANELPVRARRRLGSEEDVRGLRKFVFHRFGRVMRAREKLARLLGRRFPNLCAGHVALLLERA